MPTQRYERVPDGEQQPASAVPNSPPPSFHSRASSPAANQRLLRRATTDVDPTLEDTFDVRSDNEDDDDEDDRQRLMHGAAAATPTGQHSPVRPTPAPAPGGSRRNVNMTSANSYTDGVFANMSAKPEAGEKDEELPPSYEQAAADATPPYWETTILAPGMLSDEVFIDGLPVGSVFSFAWNAMISMAFQLIGFLLTYLLHTTHAARNGSRAGLGVTLIGWGYQMMSLVDAGDGADGGQYGNAPPDPNSHNFDPNAVGPRLGARQDDGGADAGVATSWLAYAVMILGWVVLIKACTDFIKARRHEQLILQSPERGLGVAVVAEGEAMDAVV